MSPSFKNITSRDIVKVLHKLNYILDRQSGSHAIYYESHSKKRVVVPLHGKTVLKLKTLNGILNDMGISFDEFISILKG